MDGDDLIIAGDFNFTTNINEIWGVGALPDPLVGFFNNLFDKNNLVDAHLAELVPTWRNGRSGSESIQKRLDKVYVSDMILANSSRF